MWTEVCAADQVLENGGACIKWQEKHIAIYHFKSINQWYALDNRCPHEGQSVLSRGLLGALDGRPKVSCPLHKQSFCLESGLHLGGEQSWHLQTYPIEIRGGRIFLDLPGEGS